MVSVAVAHQANLSPCSASIPYGFLQALADAGTWGENWHVEDLPSSVSLIK